MSFDRFLREMLGSAMSSVFDPPPISLKQTDEKGVAPVRSACQKIPEAIHDLTRELNRNQFLCGCLGFTERAPIEHLIVGLGSKYGSTTRIASLAHVVGTEANVSIPPSLRATIAAHVNSTHKAEALIFHNHPPNLLNAIFDNFPLPSPTDRQTMLSHMLQPLLAVKAILGGGRVRCYLGENGFVREFRTPELLTLIESFAHPARAGQR